MFEHRLFRLYALSMQMEDDEVRVEMLRDSDFSLHRASFTCVFTQMSYPPLCVLVRLHRTV